jgi:hypothetical protein
MMMMAFIFWTIRATMTHGGTFSRWTLMAIAMISTGATMTTMDIMCPGSSIRKSIMATMRTMILSTVMKTTLKT